MFAKYFYARKYFPDRYFPGNPSDTPAPVEEAHLIGVAVQSYSLGIGKPLIFRRALRRHDRAIKQRYATMTKEFKQRQKENQAEMREILRSKVTGRLQTLKQAMKAAY